MPTLRSTQTEYLKSLSRQEVTQRVLRIGARARLFPPAGVLFDLWHQDQAWAAKLRSEPCTCHQPGGRHRHLYLEGGELHAGLRWEVGATLHFRRDTAGRLRVEGDLDP